MLPQRWSSSCVAIKRGAWSAILAWNTGRLVAEKDGDSQEISTIEEEELSALMGEKEDYKTEEDPSLEDDWED